jgi:hypothetical protein
MEIDNTIDGEGSNKQYRELDVIAGDEIRDPKKFKNGHEDGGISVPSANTDTCLQDVLDDNTTVLNNLDGGRRDNIITTTTTDSLSHQNDQ